MEKVFGTNMCFHSLQTGKCVARQFFGGTELVATVFPFPSNGKVCSKYNNQSATVVKEGLFPFPSNGKVCSKRRSPMSRQSPSPLRFHSLQTGKCVARREKRIQQNVPCRFPFPSNGKVYSKDEYMVPTLVYPIWFPFPSNGKVCSKREGNWVYRQNQPVSIPFKRESRSQRSQSDALSMRLLFYHNFGLDCGPIADGITKYYPLCDSC